MKGRQQFVSSEMKNILANANSDEAFRASVIKLLEEGRIISFLELLEDYTEMDIPLKTGLIY